MPDNATATAQLPLLERIISVGKMVRDDSQLAYARNLVGEFAVQVADERLKRLEAQ